MNIKTKRNSLLLPSTIIITGVILMGIVWQILTIHIEKNLSFSINKAIEYISQDLSLDNININDSNTNLLPTLITDYWQVELRKNNKIIYKSKNNINYKNQSRWSQKTTVKDSTANLFDLTVWPSEQTIDDINLWTPNAIFITGLIFFILFGIIAYLSESFLLAKKIAEKANRAKSLFLSSMSHEIRTPLNAIVGYAELIKSTPNLPDKIINQSQIITQSSKHLLELISDILDLSKIESGKMKFTLESIMLSDVLDDCVYILKNTAKAYNITLNIDPHDFTNIIVLADYIRLKQIIINLISNAIKYNRPGGEVTIVTKDNHLFGVKDTGYGISPDKQELLFQPFARLGAENTKIEGAGIGLTITKKLVELQDGELHIESHENMGTTFWLKFPHGYKSQVQSRISDHEEKNIELNIDKKILLIEDNPVNQEIVKQQFEFLGIGLDVAADGEAGLELWKNNDYALILLDCNIPKLDGHQVTKFIRESEKDRDKHISIIAFTANAYKEDISDAINAGMDDYLIKPVEMDELKYKLAKWAR